VGQQDSLNSTSRALRQKQWEARKKENGWRRIQLWLAPGADADVVKKAAIRANKKVLPA